MADLGKAYVQIVPSAKGISGSIAKAINPESISAGKKAGVSIATNIGKSMGKLGSTLTKSITLPVAGAVTAVGGLVSALGWGRLTGLDSAKAQLKGLGYEAEAVERISSLVSDTIQGTTTTMADGVAIAAGALAAGVKEGAELERYIKLVGDAAVGAGRDTGEMAQIFNRVQGSGKLMTQELNMIEEGMPGFAQAMADSLGVPQDEFRKMVTAGEVSSDQFLDVMEGFAGDMSEAYAGSWRGIVDRTKSNIGILGELMLGGVFEQSKESLANFLEYIRTDEVRGWFEDAGASIGSAFSNVLESIQNTIEWWRNLDDSVKDVIFTIGGIVLATGPVLMIISKLIGAVISAHKGFGLAKKAAAILSGAIGSISAPIVIAVAAIAGLVAGLIYLYNTNETVKEVIDTVWNFIKDLIMLVVNEVVTFVQDLMGNLANWWGENQETIRSAVEVAWNFIKELVQDIIEFLLPFIEAAWEQIKTFTETFWEIIKTVISTVMDVILGIITTIMAVIKGDWSSAWESIKGIVSTIGEGIKSVVTTWINGVKETIINILDMIFGNWEETWNKVKEKAVEIWNSITTFLTDTWESITSTISEVWNGIKEYFSEVWNSIKDVFQTAWDGITNLLEVGWLLIKELFSLGIDIIMIPWNFLWENFSEPLTKSWEFIKTFILETLEAIANWISEKWTMIKNVTSTIWNTIETVISSIWSVIKNVVSIAINVIKDTVSNIWNSIKSITLTIWNAIVTVISGVWNGIKNVVSNAINAVKNTVSNIWNSIKSITSNIWNAVATVISGVWNKIKSGVSSAINSVKSTVSSVWNSIKSTTSSVWNSIKSAITTPINAAKNAVKTAIDKIKGFMNFSWSLPKLKMPKFSVSGKFGLNPPSVPKMGIEWHAKGGIMKRAMAFGMNGNNVMVGGEAGAEAILPLNSKTLGGIGRGIVDATSGSDDNSKLDKIIDLLSNSNQVIVLDSGELVGATYPKYSEYSGSETKLDERWGRY